MSKLTMAKVEMTKQNCSDWDRGYSQGYAGYPEPTSNERFFVAGWETGRRDRAKERI